MMVRRVGLGIALAMAAAVAAIALATPAGADPVNHGEVLTLECDGLGTLEIATNGNGQWTPGLVTSDNQVLVPYAFHFEFTPAGSNQTFTEHVAKPAPRNGRLDVCTFGGSDEEGAFSGTAWVSYTPGKS
jgi:hypothetical protein